MLRSQGKQYRQTLRYRLKIYFRSGTVKQIRHQDTGAAVSVQTTESDAELTRIIYKHQAAFDRIKQSRDDWTEHIEPTTKNRIHKLIKYKPNGNRNVRRPQKR